MKLKNKEVEDLVFKTYLEEVMKKKKFLKMNYKKRFTKP